MVGVLQIGYSKLEKQINRDMGKLERLVAKYCREDKKQQASEWITWASEYALDFPQQADITEAVSLLKKAEHHLSDEGKPLYAAVRARVVKNLWNLLEEKDASADN
jgi:uncharacterized protein HemX